MLVCSWADSDWHPAQEHFDGVMREYPDSSKAMDLIAEHRLRALRSSDAWLAKHGARPATAPSAASLGSKIEHVLEVWGACTPAAAVLRTGNFWVVQGFHWCWYLSWGG